MSPADLDDFLNLGAKMRNDEAWRIRHVYSTDAEFRTDPDVAVYYMGKMRETLDALSADGHEIVSVPVGSQADLEMALRDVGGDDLLIADLHGWARDNESYKVGTNRVEGVPIATIGSWPPVAILSSCTQMDSHAGPGAWVSFIAEIAAVIRRPLTIMANFGSARMKDYAPVELMERVVRLGPPGDESLAFTHLDEYLCGDQDGWATEIIRPASDH